MVEGDGGQGNHSDTHYLNYGIIIIMIYLYACMHMSVCVCKGGSK